MEAFDDVFRDCTSLGTKIPKENYLSEGKHIVVDQGQNDIAGYTNLEDGLFEDVPAIIFGDHTRIIKYVDEPFFLGADGVKLLKSKKQDANYKYLYYALKNARIPDTGYNRHFKWLKEVRIEYPSTKKQQEIVEILDRISTVIEKRKLELRQLDELIKARFVELFGDPAYNEKKWIFKDLESVTTIVTYGLTVRPEYIEEGIDLVSARELHKGYVAYEEAPKISLGDFENLSDKGKPQKNDILFSKTGSIGHCALVEDEKPFAITQNTARIGLDIEKVNPVWLLYYLRIDYIQDWCKNHAKGNAVKDFQLQDMKIIPIFDCPLELQDSFTEFVKQVDKSKIAVQKALDETRTLFDSLMQEYFG